MLEINDNLKTAIQASLKAGTVIMEVYEEGIKNYIIGMLEINDNLKQPFKLL